MARVALDGVWKIYEQRGKTVEAVRDLTLDCEDGEFLAIVGPSGCGKSSTMRMIAGLEVISRGAISIGGRVVNTIKPADRNIAMVFENYALYPHLSVRENIVLSLEVRGVKPAEIQVLLNRAVSTLDIGDILKRKPRQLSGGQKQRVAIARAIVRNPTVLIMDEPISHIDARLRSKVRAELKHLLRDLNATTIYVTHNQAEALSMADRIAVMSDGELQQVGTAEDIYEHPVNLFVADFVGEPPMNLMPCEPVRDNGHLLLRVAPMAIAPSRRLRDLLERRQDQGELVLGVRPVDVELSWSPEAEAVGTGTVSLVENLGDEQIVAVRVGDRSLESVVDASVSATVGDRVWLLMQPERVHVFDLGTGRSLAA
ncbi:MAG: ABC transporter ATP-binding protein [Thermomicrobiales bacterium]